MAFFEDLTKKTKDLAYVAADKAKDVAAVAADKAKDAAELTRISMAIAGEQREIDKNYRTIGEWFVSEYEGEIPDAVRDLVEAVNTSKAKIAEQVAAENIGEPTNLEEQALSLVGRDIFETLVKGYTEKQWGRDCKDLPASIIKRLPCRFTYDNNYFNDRYQGIPMGGYTKMVANMLEGVEVRCGVEYKELAAAEPDIAARTIYCGPIDSFYDFKLGTLEYRSLRFETETLDEQDHQGVAVVNYTEREVPYTRIIEHKHFEFGTQEKTVITREYPADWKPGDEPYYPINDAKNEALYKQYEELAAQEGDVVFAGRLGGYKYYDMDKAIAAAFELVRNELGVEPTEA